MVKIEFTEVKNRVGYKMHKDWAGGQVLPTTVKLNLQQAVMSQAGIRQLTAGQPISNPKDQAIVSGIVVAALR